MAPTPIQEGLSKPRTLKNCPFCGGKPKLTGTPLNFPCTLARAIVICKCDAQIQKEGPVENFSEKCDEAANMWNMRAPSVERFVP